ncbi:MAG: FtsW/RodA/SpoVE family cell cycle protein [Oscillospiraceae bacterium]
MKRFFGAIVQYIKDTDRWLLLLCMIASAFSVVLLLGITNSEMVNSRRVVIVQAGAAVIGLTVAIIMSKIDYHTMAKLWKFHVPFTLLLVLLTFFFRLQRSGADDKAWLPLPFGLSLQPAELLKISFILTFSLHLSKVKENLNSLKNIALLCVHGAIPTLLIHFQGDDGTALVFLMIFLFILFSAGVSWKYILSAVGVLAVGIPVAWFGIMSNDQKLRVLSIFNPALDPQGIGYQQLKGRIAIGSGQIFGTGIFSGDHYYVPEIQNDFIFSFIGEALGFVGTIATLILLGAICFKILWNTRHCSDDLGFFICVGVFAMFSVQIMVNVGMCLSMLPVIGLTLPFLSAGGTSVVTLYLGIGLALSVYVHNKPRLFYN